MSSSPSALFVVRRPTAADLSSLKSLFQLEGLSDATVCRFGLVVEQRHQHSGVRHLLSFAFTFRIHQSVEQLRDLTIEQLSQLSVDTGPLAVLAPLVCAEGDHRDAAVRMLVHHIAHTTATMGVRRIATLHRVDRGLRSTSSDPIRFTNSSLPVCLLPLERSHDSVRPLIEFTQLATLLDRVAESKSCLLPSQHPHKGFLSLGLTSHSLLELTSCFRATFGEHLEIVTMFDYPTLSSLAKHLQTRKQSVDTEPAALAPSKSSRCHNSTLQVAGACCTLPGGVSSSHTFSANMLEARDAITLVPLQRWAQHEWYEPDLQPGKMYTQVGGFIEASLFDAAFFAVRTHEVLSMSPSQRLLLEHAAQVLHNESPNTHSTAVYVGSCHHDWERLQCAPEASFKSPYATTGMSSSVLAGCAWPASDDCLYCNTPSCRRISYHFGCTGPSLVVDTACSSSLVAASLAGSCLLGEGCSQAVVAGENLLLDPITTVLYCQTQMVSPDGRCKTFDMSANGYVSERWAAFCDVCCVRCAQRVLYWYCCDLRACGLCTGTI